MARRRRLLGSIQKLSPRDAWWVLAAFVVIGLFFWSAWQTHELDELYRERVQLERNLVYARLSFRDVQTRWYAQIEPDRVLSRAANELDLVAEDASGRSLVALPPERAEAGGVGSWFGQVAQRLDRFGEITDAYAEGEIK
jgi:hypothetical protein